MLQSVTFDSATVHNFAGAISYQPGAAVSRQVMKSKKGNVTLFAFDAGQGLSEHTAPFNALVYVIEGKAQITIGNKSLDVSAGEGVIMPANVSHALHAIEAFKMILTMIKS